MASQSVPFSSSGSQGSEALAKIVDFYPEDNNSLQISCLSLRVGWSVPLKAVGPGV